MVSSANRALGLCGEVSMVGLHPRDPGGLANDLLRRMPGLRSYLGGIRRVTRSCAIADHLPTEDSHFSIGEQS